MPQRLYLFIGFPGSGKTTVAKLIAERSGAVHLWADHERQAMFKKVSHSQQESEQLYEALNERTDRLMATGKSVVFDTNFNYRRDRDKLRAIADVYKAETMIIWIKTPIELSRQRALHDDHRERNRYETVMTKRQFEQLIQKLEAPAKYEQFITIDGSDIDKHGLLRQLGL